MRLTYDEFKSRPTPPHPDRVVQQQAVMAVAKRAETVVAHEGWQTFLDHLGALKDMAQNDLDSSIGRITQGSLVGADLEIAIRTVQYDRGMTAAYQAAMDLIPTLIERGQSSANG